jgi:hypothetical protein
MHQGNFPWGPAGSHPIRSQPSGIFLPFRPGHPERDEKLSSSRALGAASAARGGRRLPLSRRSASEGCSPGSDLLQPQRPPGPLGQWPADSRQTSCRTRTRCRPRVPRTYRQGARWPGRQQNAKVRSAGGYPGPAQTPVRGLGPDSARGFRPGSPRNCPARFGLGNIAKASWGPNTQQCPVWTVLGLEDVASRLPAVAGVARQAARQPRRREMSNSGLSELDCAGIAVPDQGPQRAHAGVATTSPARARQHCRPCQAAREPGGQTDEDPLDPGSLAQNFGAAPGRQAVSERLSPLSRVSGSD